MLAVLDAPVIASPSPKKSLPAAMEAYKFQPGHKGLRGAGRPKGSRDAATIYMDSLPLKAKQWVKSTNPAVLIDARKLAIPDAEPVNPLAPQIIVFVGTSPNNNPLLVAADASASLSLPVLPAHA